MRTVLEFPNGFGSDASPIRGSAAASKRRPAVSQAAEASMDDREAATDVATYVPGPFRADCLSGSKSMVTEDGPMASLSFVSGGFRPQLVPDQVERDEPVCREPQSVVVTAMIVGVLLAALGTFLDIR